MSRIDIPEKISPNNLWIENVISNDDIPEDAIPEDPFWLMRRRLPSGRLVNIDVSYGIDLAPACQPRQKIRQLQKLRLVGAAHADTFDSSKKEGELIYVTFDQAVKLLDDFKE